MLLLVLPRGARAGARSDLHTAAHVEVLADAATSVVVITRGELEASGARDLGEALRSVPGLFVQATNGSSGAHAYIRGGDPNFTLVLLDGVPLNDETEAQGGAFDVTSLAISTIERVEIEKGPRSASAGSRALGGVIHVYSRSGDTRRGDLAAGVGTSSHRWSSASWSKGGSDPAFVALDYDRERGRIGGDGATRGQVVARTAHAIGRVRLQLGGRFGVREVDDYPEASGGPGGGGGIRRGDSAGGSATAALHVEGGFGLSHDVTAAGTWHQLDRDSPGVLPLVPPSREDSSFRRFRLGWKAARALGPSRLLRLDLGVERELGRMQSTFEAGDSRFAGDYDVARTQGGVALDLAGVASAWTYEVGARFDLAEGYRPRLSPRVSAARGLGRERATRVFAALAQGFKLPSFFALASPDRLGGNPALEPERGFGVDAGVEQRLAAAARLTVTGYWTRYSDLVDFDFASFRHLNRGRVRARGLEIAATTPFSTKFRFDAAVAFSATSDLDSGERLLRRASGGASLALTFQPGDDPLLRVEARWVGTIRDHELTIPTREEVDDHVTVDAVARWLVGARTRVDARVANLLGTSYETLVGYPGPGRAFDLGVRLGF